jgi:hypothetical protein
MKTTIIKIMNYAGYDFIKEEPLSRLLFYDNYSESDVQVWLKDDDDANLEYVINLIGNRTYENGFCIGMNEVRNEIKAILGI